MKKFIIFALATSITLSASIVTSNADIQSPPGGKHNRVRKLGRAIGNILYGLEEIPYNWRRTLNEEGATSAASIGLLKGSYRTLVRAGFGVYEFVTFPFPTYKGSFKPGYRGKSIWWDMNNGYHEVAPEGLYQSRFDYNREQKW